MCSLQLKKLQDSLHNSETQIEQLNAQILTLWQEKDVHVQEVATHIKMLQQSQDKVKKDSYIHLYTYLGSLNGNKSNLLL